MRTPGTTFAVFNRFGEQLRRVKPKIDYKSGRMTAEETRWRQASPVCDTPCRWIFQHQLATVILIGIVAAGLFGFIELADEVTEGGSKQFDSAILLSMRNSDDLSDPIGPGWVEEMARDITALGSLLVLAGFTLFSVGYLLLTRKNWIAIFVAFSIVCGALASNELKSGFDRPRPDLVPHATQVYTQSFPSGHSAMSAVVFLTLGALISRVQSLFRTKVYFLGIAIFLTVIVGVSRVYLGVHWPTDVLAGWMFGVTWASATWLIFRWFDGKRRSVGNVEIV